MFGEVRQGGDDVGRDKIALPAWDVAEPSNKQAEGVFTKCSDEIVIDSTSEKVAQELNKLFATMRVVTGRNE